MDSEMKPLSVVSAGFLYLNKGDSNIELSDYHAVLSLNHPVTSNF